MTEILTSEVMRSALLPAMLIAILASGVSVMVVAHRLSFLTVGISHATLVGLAFAVMFSLPVMLCATISAIAVSIMLAGMPGRQGLGRDTGTGILFATAMALGILMISLSGKYRVDLFGILFGNILTVPGPDLNWIFGATVLALFALLAAARNWWSIAFDAEAAEASGISVNLYRTLLYAIIGLTVVVCVKLAGIVLTAGLLVLPAACAWFWGRGLLSLLAISFAFSMLGTFTGMAASYHWDWPSGATVVLTLGTLFVISWSMHRLIQRLHPNIE